MPPLYEWRERRNAAVAQLPFHLCIPPPGKTRSYPTSSHPLLVSLCSIPIPVTHCTPDQRCSIHASTAPAAIRAIFFSRLSSLAATGSDLICSRSRSVYVCIVSRAAQIRRASAGVTWVDTIRAPPPKPGRATVLLCSVPLRPSPSLCPSP